MTNSDYDNNEFGDNIDLENIISMQDLEQSVGSGVVLLSESSGQLSLGSEKSSPSSSSSSSLSPSLSWFFERVFDAVKPRFRTKSSQHHDTALLS